MIETMVHSIGVQAREQASESEGITPGDPTVTYKFIIVDGAGSVELGITAPVNEAFDYSGNQPILFRRIPG